ncbi:DUF2157 domain-containing protein [Ammoniphilus sp. 3BR4]|uniref:DUF2157 domain-containing protein n=1 Tax=Ammoniphilus sp. 3BR4 TaxID=3158265 RepID=UPI003467E2E2
MSHKWLRREGPLWVEKQIITHEQYEEIQKLYPDPPRRISQILPILASVLVGLSLLTFVASNWEEMSHLARLIILSLTMVGFYSSGFALYRQGHHWVGQGLLSLGVVTFGAGMILVGQMFHLVAYDARLFVFWSLAGLGTLYLYRHHLFFLLSSVLLAAGQIYALSSFGEASWMLFVLTLIGLGSFTYRAKHPFVGWVLAFLIGLQTILIFVGLDVAWSWITLVPLGMYLVGLALEHRPMSQGFLIGAPAISFTFAALMVFIHQEVYKNSDFLANPLAYLVSFIILSLLTIWKSGGKKSKWLPFFLFAPLFLLSHGDIAYLIAMFMYAASLIFLGDQENEPWKSKMGVFLFMFSSFVGYIQLAWDFLDKSLFFLIGGLMLFAIHWALRKRSRWTAKGGE